jgi:hypothetical protein
LVFVSYTKAGAIANATKVDTIANDRHILTPAARSRPGAWTGPDCQKPSSRLLVRLDEQNPYSMNSRIPPRIAERLEKLFDLYTKMTAGTANANRTKKGKARA